MTRSDWSTNSPYGLDFDVVDEYGVEATGLRRPNTPPAVWAGSSRRNTKRDFGKRGSIEARRERRSFKAPRGQAT